jgi:hypothetical protein
MQNPTFARSDDARSCHMHCCTTVLVCPVLSEPVSFAPLFCCACAAARPTRTRCLILIVVGGRLLRCAGATRNTTFIHLRLAPAHAACLPPHSRIRAACAPRGFTVGSLLFAWCSFARRGHHVLSMVSCHRSVAGSCASACSSVLAVRRG